MSNIIEIVTTNIPTNLSTVNVYVTDTMNNKLHEGKGSVAGNSVKIDLGTIGNAGEGVLVYVDNWENGVSSLKGCIGYSTITLENSTFLDLSGRIYNTTTIDQNSEIWSII